MMGAICRDSDYPEFVEVDPTGRYGRYNEILGKGASKTVYKAFDEYEGIEVAWNQVKLYDFLQSSEDLERLYCEIHLLKTLKHKNIMKFYTSWVDTSNRNINFVTEMFTSGTLRQYRQKHRRVNIRAVKHWCRQILSGLLYLHSHDPPIIHRDLKCDNIFVNGNTGEVKIGDLGLAAILRKSHAVHCVGTPEFMAPEVYAEEYNELVDIYSFGMCVLEMVTFEYPYSECSHPAQIYKKVISGTKPEALYRVDNPEVREFVEKCLATASRRLSARELLKDPFLQTNDPCSGYLDEEFSCLGFIFQEPSLHLSQCNGSLIASEYSSNVYGPEWENDWDYDYGQTEVHGLDLFSNHEDEHPPNVDITIKGRKREDGSIFLRLRIADKDGRVRNIYFPFDLEADTALSVATEMVAELDITEYEVTRIAEMIDGEVSKLVPDWKPGPGIEDIPGLSTANLCKRCSSNVSSCGSLLEYISMKNPSCADLQSFHCECAETHGRFEEITFQVEGSECCDTEGAPMVSSQSAPDLSSQALRGVRSKEAGELMKDVKKGEKEEPRPQEGLEFSEARDQFFISGDEERDTPQEQRWTNSRYQAELQEYHVRRKDRSRRNSRLSADFDNIELAAGNEVLTSVAGSKTSKTSSCKQSFHLGTNNSFRVPESDRSAAKTNNTIPSEETLGYCWSSRPNIPPQRGRNCEVSTVCGPEIMATANNLYHGARLSNALTRSKALPVDAVDV